MSEAVQNLTQFKQTPMVGQQDWTVNNNLVPVQINPSSTGGALLVAGQAFKLIAGTGDVPLVDIVSASTDTPYGVAIHNMKGDTFVAGQYIVLALQGSVVYMQASAAITRGSKVQVDPTGPTVSTLTNLPVNASLGQCIDQPTASGQLCRISINPQDPNQSAY